MPVHCFCVGSSTHLPPTGHAASLVHQQHCAEPPQPPWLTSYAVFGVQPWLPPRLHVGATTEQPAESVNWPPVHLPEPEQCLLLQPPLLTTSMPLLLHCESSVQRQYWCFESHTGEGAGRVVGHTYVGGAGAALSSPPAASSPAAESSPAVASSLAETSSPVETSSPAEPPSSPVPMPVPLSSPADDPDEPAEASLAWLVLPPVP